MPAVRRKHPDFRLPPEAVLRLTKRGGIVVVDKPPEWTSRDVVDAISRWCKPAKAGHAGTLDPLATGVLVVGLGAATRLLQFIQRGVKTYLAEFQLGWRSDTDDVTGALEAVADPSHLTQADLSIELARFVGTIAQVPPRFSAVHVDGQRAYDLARAGQEFELSERTVEIERIDLLKWEPPHLTIRMRCGSGTYVRSVGRDLGTRLGCGGVMTALRRESVGPFTLAGAVSVESPSADAWNTAVMPSLAALADWPQAALDAAALRRAIQGQAVNCPQRLMPATRDLVDADMCDGTEVALVDESQELAGLARYVEATRTLHPFCMLPAE